MKTEPLTLHCPKDILTIEKKPLLEHLVHGQTTYAILRKAAQQFAQKTALVFLPMGDPLANLDQITIKSQYTYQELLAGINQTANMLRQLGVEKGDAVSYILPNIPENYFLLYAAQATGIANPISPVLPMEQITDLLNTANSKILVTLGEHAHPELWDTVLKIRSLCPHLEKILVIGGKSNPQEDIFDFHQLVTEQPLELLFNSDCINPQDVCSYFHTSGTTSRPKLATHNHFGNAYMAWAMNLFTQYHLPDTVVLSGLPMFHVGAPMVSGLMAFQQGAKVVVMSPLGWMDPFVVTHFWKITEKYKGTTTTALPFIYNALAQLPMDKIDISSLREAISGMAVAAVDFKLFKEKTGVKIATLWGQTEVTSIGTFNPQVDVDDPHYGSMGIRLPFEQIKTVKLNTQGHYIRDCLPDEDGILCVKGPHILGYKKAELNEIAFIQPGWFNTRDWVKQNEDYFSILGRAEDFIQLEHTTISLLKIERISAEHPMIAEVTAVGVPDSEKLRDVPVLFGVLKPGTHLTPDQLLQWIKSQHFLEAEAIPVKIIITDHLPKNGMGKPLKYVLRERLIQSETTCNYSI